MAESKHNLNTRSIAVLELIAAGNTYEQILTAYPDFTYLDIFRAAEEALALADYGPTAHGAKYSKVQKTDRRLRSFEVWSDAEDARLRHLVQGGATVAQIAGRLLRQRSEIRTRITDLNLMAELSPGEQRRLLRFAARDKLP